MCYICCPVSLVSCVSQHPVHQFVRKLGLVLGLHSTLVVFLLPTQLHPVWDWKFLCASDSDALLGEDIAPKWQVLPVTLRTAGPSQWCEVPCCQAGSGGHSGVPFNTASLDSGCVIPGDSLLKDLIFPFYGTLMSWSLCGPCQRNENISYWGRCSDDSALSTSCAFYRCSSSFLLSLSLFLFVFPTHLSTPTLWILWGQRGVWRTCSSVSCSFLLFHQSLAPKAEELGTDPANS